MPGGRPAQPIVDRPSQAFLGKWRRADRIEPRSIQVAHRGKKSRRRFDQAALPRQIDQALKPRIFGRYAPR